ncbi:MAG: hypothetical protein EWM45_04035 [Rhodopseudomonas palustris]|nr:MAG: hypothetical protein EWM45_04035 [Rhodopseudomonas palustris]
MAERLEWHSSWHAEQAWLAALVDAFERVTVAEIAATPCDPTELAACERYLARPSVGAIGAVSRLLN